MGSIRLVLLLCAVSAWGVSVPTAQYDNFRSSANNQEAVLTSKTVAGLVRLDSYAVDGPVWNQPLIATNISGRDLMLACTMQDTCYAFDARKPGTQPVWSTHLAQPRTNYYDIAYGILYQNPAGCLSTPVIDLFTQVVYAMCGTSTPAWILFELNLRTGAVLAQAAVSGSVTGTGDTSVNEPTSGGLLSFNPDRALSRPALTLSNGIIYAGFGSYDDGHPWHGWIMAYDAATLTQQAIYCVTPNGYGGSVWLSGGGFAVDEKGNLYVPTGNGTTGTAANSVVKFSPSLQLLGSYTPANPSQLESQDWDLASGRPALIPNTSLLVFASKDSNFYSLDTSCMCNAQIIAITSQCSGFSSPSCGTYGGSVVGNGSVYFPAHPGGVFSYALNGTTWSAGPQSPAYGYPGSAMTFTSDSGNNPVLWGVTASADAVNTIQQGTLRAWDAGTMTELWNSGTFGQMAKFADPTVANGYVYLSTIDSGIVVWGLPAPANSVVTVGGKGLIGGQGSFR